MGKAVSVGLGADFLVGGGVAGIVALPRCFVAADVDECCISVDVYVNIIGAALVVILTTVVPGDRVETSALCVKTGGSSATPPTVASTVTTGWVSTRRSAGISLDWTEDLF